MKHWMGIVLAAGLCFCTACGSGGEPSQTSQAEVQTEQATAATAPAPESGARVMNACFDAEERAELENEIPAGRFAAPSEVADFVQQLIDAPSYLTGQIISFDGGYL